MKNQIIILDDYLNQGAKVLVLIFMIWLFFGSLSLFRSPLFLKDFAVGILCLLGLILLGTLLMAKKTLFKENGHTYQGLVLKDRIFLKKQIDLKKVKSLNVYENKDQTTIPWWISMVGNLLTSDSAFKFKLELTTGKENYLISFRSAESKNKAVNFFQNHTNLEIKHFE